jgi:2-oxoisovalerate dehydrogenase E1 component beta subunit
VPWDVEAVCDSVSRTGRLVVTHEACVTGGFGAEIAAKVEERCFLSLEAPTQRVAGWDTHWPYAFDELSVPGVARLVEAARRSVAY